MRGQRRPTAALTALSLTVLTLAGFRFGSHAAAESFSPDLVALRQPALQEPAPGDPPPLAVTLPATPPSADPLLQVLGTTPQPPPGSNSGVVALTPDGRFVVFEHVNPTVDQNGNLNPTPARVGIAAPGRPPVWFRPEPQDPAEFRRVTGGDAAGRWVVWREEPFPGTPGDVVLTAHDRRTGATTELLRVSAPVTVQKPRILGGRAYWEQRDAQSGTSSVWSVALSGGTPRMEVAGGSQVAVDRCGTARALLYATTSADGATAAVHRRSVNRGVLGPATTVFTHAFGAPSTQVIGLAACDGAIALSSGRPYPGGLPGWVRGRILLRNADGAAVEFALPDDRVGRDVVLSERLLGFVGTYVNPFQPQQQVIVDRATNSPYLLAETPGGSNYAPQTGLVSLAGDDLVAWNTIVNWTFSQGVAARYVGAPGGT